MKLIKFKLEKDRENNVIKFTLYDYNPNTKYHNKTVCVNFINKNVSSVTRWQHCYMNADVFSVDFSSSAYEIFRDYWTSRDNYKNRHCLLRIGTCVSSSPSTYNIKLEDGENIDAMCDLILKTFEILSNGIKLNK